MTTLPLFNSQLINSIPKNLHFKSLNEQTRKLLIEVNLYYQELGLYYVGKRDREQHRQNLIEAIDKLNAAKFTENLNYYRGECSHIKNYKMNLILKKFMMSDPWDNWLKITANDKNIIMLKTLWELNKETHHLSNEALIVAVNDIMRVYEDFYNLVRAELKLLVNYLPTDCKNEIENYLDSLKEFLNAERIKICTAMLSRLQVVSQTKDFFSSDVNAYLINRLSDLGIKPNDAMEPRKNQALKEHHFVIFHNYILRHGSALQKNELKKLEWFVKDKKYSADVSGSKIVIVPTSFEKPNLFVKVLSWLQSLFSAVDKRSYFFSKKMYLLARIRCHEQPFSYKKLNFEELIKPVHWQKLTAHENYLLNELQDLTQKSSSTWNKVFKPLYIKNYQCLKKCVSVALLISLENKIRYAEVVAEQLRTRMMFDLDVDIILSDHFKSFVRKMIEDIENFLTTLKRSQVKTYHWQRTKCILEIFLNKYDIRKTPKVLVKDCDNKGGLVSVSEEINNIYSAITAKGFFDITLVAKCFNSWKALFLLGENQIKKDFNFWKHFALTYIDTRITLANDSELLIKLRNLIYQFGHERIIKYVNDMGLFSSNIQPEDYLPIKSVVVSLKEENTIEPPSVAKFSSAHDKPSRVNCAA